MITSVSLNPSIDKSVSIERFNFGSMNRVVETRQDAGGKAINLAYVAANLGLDVRCVGLARKGGSEIIENKLAGASVPTRFLTLAGTIRTNMKLLDLSKGVVTEINEKGDTVDHESLMKVRDMILECASDSEFLVLTGSLPPGCPKDFYADIIKEAPCKCVLDCEGEPLEAGVAAKPYLIKPNRMELEMLVGRGLESIAEIKDAAVSLCRRGVALVAVSLGSEGALLTDGTETYFSPAAKVTVKSTVGAGDSMVAGMISGLVNRSSMDDVLRRGAACATASITHAGTELMDRETYLNTLDKIKVERM